MVDQRQQIDFEQLFQSRQNQLPKIILQKEAYIKKCCDIIVNKNQENLKLHQNVNKLSSQNAFLKQNNQELSTQLSQLQQSYIDLLAAHQQKRSQQTECREIQAQIKVKELQRQLALALKQNQLKKFSKPIQQQLLDLLKASQQRIKNLQYQLSLKEQPIRKKQSTMVLMTSQKGKYGTNQGHAFHKRFQQKQFNTALKSCKQNQQPYFFQSKKGLFGLDLDAGRKSSTPNKKKYGNKK